MTTMSNNKRSTVGVSAVVASVEVVAVVVVSVVWLGCDIACRSRIAVFYHLQTVIKLPQPRNNRTAIDTPLSNSLCYHNTQHRPQQSADLSIAPRTAINTVRMSVRAAPTASPRGPASSRKTGRIFGTQCCRRPANRSATPCPR